MRFFEVEHLITEAARGLLYRSQGDIFKDQTGKEIVFLQVGYVPGQPGAFETYDEMMEAYAKLQKMYPGVIESNKPSSQSRAFAVLEFQESGTQNKLYFVRFFQNIKADMAGAWQNGGLPGNWQLQKASSLKASYKLKPADIFNIDARFGSVGDTISAAEQSGKLDETLINGLKMLLNKQLPTFPGYKEKEAAVRDDLGETIAPLAIMQNMVNDGGIMTARKVLLGNRPWSSCVLSFPKGKNAGLIDSYLTPKSGLAIGISSKGAEGAKASAANIISGLRSVREKANDSDPSVSDSAKQLLTDYKKVVAILDEIGNGSIITGPLSLGIKYGFIDQSEATAIQEAIQQGTKDWAQAGYGPNSLVNIQKVMGNIGGGSRAVDYKNPRYNVGYHALAGLARAVAEKVNSTKGFSECALKLLNNAPLIQVHMHTTSNGNDVTVTGFDTIYPPQFQGTLTLVADKSYYALGAGGKFGFGF
jgi:hypothetical protein